MRTEPLTRSRKESSRSWRMPRKPRKRALCYAQSGGVTSVINATAASVVQAAVRHRLPGVYGACNGILGVLEENLVDFRKERREAIEELSHTPGGALGSCRYKLPDPEKDMSVYRRLADVFTAHDIGYLLYNGGNDSQDATEKIARGTAMLGHGITCIGIPKTIDNDLVHMDCCPGFGSVAKYVATSVLETALDLKSMSRTSTRILVIEVMGRHAGWIAAASGLASKPGDPHMILFPEIPFEQERFLVELDRMVKRHGHCVVIASEGVSHTDGTPLAAGETRDAYGHAQLGGVAPKLSMRINDTLGHKVHWAVADYLQRAARHVASQTDYDHARKLGEIAVDMAIAGEAGQMPAICRVSDEPYRWKVGKIAAASVANREKRVPRHFMTRNGYHITEPCRRYLRPLINGEAPSPFRDGLPVHAKLEMRKVRRKLGKWSP